jgi:RNA polymerase sigma factor (sigma-70 family)
MERPLVGHLIDTKFRPIVINGEKDLTEAIKTGNAVRINGAILQVYQSVFESSPVDTSLFDLYSRFAEHLPYFVSSEINQKLLTLAESKDKDESQAGKQAFVMLHMRAVLSGVKPFLTGNMQMDNDIVQSALGDTIELTRELGEHVSQASAYICGTSGDAAKEYLAKEFQVRADWVEKGVYREIIREIDEYFFNCPDGLSEWSAGSDVVREIAEKYDVSYASVRFHLRKRNAQITVKSNDDQTVEEVNKKASSTESALERLDKRQQVIITGRLEGKPLEEIGEENGVSREAIRQQEVKAQTNLREWYLSKKMQGNWYYDLFIPEEFRKKHFPSGVYCDPRRQWSNYSEDYE